MENVEIEEAMNKMGHGRYNYLLLAACCVINYGGVTDMFGYGLVVPAATCDLELTEDQANSLKSVSFAGFLFAFPWGYIADTRGRKPVLIVSSAVAFLFSALASFSYSYHMMLALKFLAGCFSTAAMTMTTIYLGESTCQIHRRKTLFFQNVFSIGVELFWFILAYIFLSLKIEISVPFLPYKYKSWRLFSLSLSLPLGIGAVMMCFLRESPMFLANKGETDKAIKVLRRIFEVNNGKNGVYPVNSLMSMNMCQESKYIWVSVWKHTVPIFKPPLLWRTFQFAYLLSICSFTNNILFVWFPRMVNIFVTDAPENMSFCQVIAADVTAFTRNKLCYEDYYTNIIFSGLILSFLFTILDITILIAAAFTFSNWRRSFTIISFFLAGVCCVLVDTVNDYASKVVLYIIVQLTALCFSSINSYYVGVFPTSHRGLAASIGMMVARLTCLGGLDLIGDVVVKYCRLTFFSWAFILFGHGRYNQILLLTCCIITNGAVMDMLGYSLVVPAASCDLELTLQQEGILKSISFAGFLFAVPWGYIADTFGRKRTILLSIVLGFIFSAMASFSNSFYMMLGLKFLASCFSTASLTLITTYLGESICQNKRNKYIFIQNISSTGSDLMCFFLGYCIFAVSVPYLNSYKSWRLFSLLMSLPLGLGAVMICFLKESPKYLNNRGKTDEAMNVLKDMFKTNYGNNAVYPVKSLMEIEHRLEPSSFWNSVAKQTTPIFKPPLLWRSFQLLFLLTVCCSTNNVFFMWFPTMANSFFTSIEENASFCEKVIANITSTVHNDVCIENNSMNMIYSGMLCTFFCTVLNIVALAFANWRRTLIFISFLIAAISCLVVNFLTDQIISMVLFCTIQFTIIAIGSVFSYYVDIFPTSCRGLATGLGIMVARISSLGGIAIVGTTLIDYCQQTFYFWTVLLFCGVVAVVFLPKDTSERNIKVDE